ncbi:MAG TPA: hypothetical protein VGL61_34775 [Kofleriaceae bacterium]
MSSRAFVYFAALAPAVAVAQPAPAGGLELGATGGAMLAETSGKDSTAYGGSLWGGYEIIRGDVGITPLAEMQFETFTGAHSGEILYVLPGVKLGFHRGAWIPAVDVGAGYAHAWAGTGARELARQSYTALSVGAELMHQILPRFAIGIALHYRPVVAPDAQSFVDFGASAIVTL